MEEEKEGPYSPPKPWFYHQSYYYAVILTGDGQPTLWVTNNPDTGTWVSVEVFSIN